jgi:hypothetical protein
MKRRTVFYPFIRTQSPLLRDEPRDGEPLTYIIARARRAAPLMPPGANIGWTYYRAGVNGRGQSIRWCVSKARNHAGYWLVWREVQTLAGAVKRDRWTGRRKRYAAHDLAKERAGWPGRPA